MHDIATPFYAHKQMQPELQLISDLMGGARAMRQAGLRWLPREAAESWPAWRARLNRTVLFNAFDRTVHMLAGKPLAFPMNVSSHAPILSDLLKNMDGQGMLAAVPKILPRYWLVIIAVLNG